MFSLKVDEEINLTLANPAYAERMFQLIEFDREYLSQWLSWPALTSKVSDCEAAATQMLHSYADGKSMTCYIFYQEQLVGVAGFNVINHALSLVEVGYWLASAHQGKGIVTRVCRKLISIAFEDLKLEKVQISAAEHNASSRAVCERLGFELEGMIKNAENLNGRIVNHAVYGRINNTLTTSN